VSKNIGIKSNKKKSNMPIAITIIVLGVVIIASIIFYVIYLDANTVRLFQHEHRHVGASLYESTVGRNIEQDFPHSPLELMRLYNDISFFLYGGIIVDDDLFMDVINLQRRLLSPELQESITAQQQFNHIKNAVNTLNEQGVFVRRSEVEHIQYDFYDQSTAIANIRQFLAFYGNVFWRYQLEVNESNQWMIVSWERVDESFLNPM